MMGSIKGQVPSDKSRPVKTNPSDPPIYSFYPKNAIAASSHARSFCPSGPKQASNENGGSGGMSWGAPLEGTRVCTELDDPTT
jgi:hypothetical protein